MLPSETLTLTPTETPTETATATFTETTSETPTFTASPEATAELYIPTETAAAEVTAEITPEITAEVTPEVTESPTAAMPSETATATGTATTTLLPETPLNLVYYEGFRGGEDPARSLRPMGNLTRVGNNLALQVRRANTPTRIAPYLLSEVALQTAVLLNAGVAQWSVRQSESGAYTAVMDTTGQMMLLKNGQPMASAVIINFNPSQWHIVRLSATSTGIRVIVDGQEVIAVGDPAPLGAGFISFGGDNLIVDDIQVWSGDMLATNMQAQSASGFSMLSSTYSATPGELFTFVGETVIDSVTVSGIIAYDVYNSTATVLIEPNPGGPILGVGNPVWSPDHTQLAFNCALETAIYNICIATFDPATLAFINLIALPKDDPNTLEVFASWSPDGQYVLVYTSDPNTGTQLIARRTTSPYTVTTVKSLSDFPSGSFFSDQHWGADGYIYFSLQDLTGQTLSIYRLEFTDPPSSPQELVYRGAFEGYWDDVPETSISGMEVNSDGDMLYVVEETGVHQGLSKYELYVTRHSANGEYSIVSGQSDNQFRKRPEWSPLDNGEFALRNYGEDSLIYISHADTPMSEFDPAPIDLSPTTILSYPFDWTVRPTSQCGAAFALGEWPNWSVLRDFPSVDTGVRIQSLPYGTEVTLLGKYFNLTEGLWWWHVSLAENPAAEGWTREDVVNGDDPNSCANEVEAFRIPPPPPPGICEVQLRTDPNITYLVYGISNDGSQYLVSQIDQQPQQWVTVGTVNNVSQYARACDPGVIGIIRYLPLETETTYMDSLAFYANNFLAPVNQTYYTNLDPSNNIVDPTYGNIHVVYNAFRISQYFFYGGHDGLDIVYKPPIGNEQTDISRDLAVYVPYQGVVVEAGPDSLTYTNILHGAYDNLPSWIKDACAAMDPGDDAGETCLPTNRYFFQVYRHTDGIAATVTVALNYDEDPDPQDKTKKETEGLNSGGLPVPTLSFDKFQEIAENPNFTLDCDFTLGCSIGGGRQLIIWHEAGDGDATPDIATLYYHVTMQQYDIWQQNCSTKADPRLDIWQAAINDPNHHCWVYVSTPQEPERGYIGRAQQIGFSTGTHLHYGVAVDRDNLIDDDANGNMFTTQGSSGASLNPNEEIDPSIAVDIHMPPGKGGTGHSD